MTRAALSLGFAIAAGTAVPAGHHSLYSMYDTGRQATVEGVVTAFHFVNPHPYLLVTVKDRNGAAEWRLELDNRRELVDVGMHEQTLKPGDRIVASGSPGRQQETRLYVRRLERPADGFEYEQVGFNPRIRPATRPR